MGFDIAPYGEAIARGSELLNTFVKPILQRVLPEKMSEKERADIETKMTSELLAADTSVILAQLGINAVEAKSDKLFVSGWRPAVGWTCAAAFGYTFVLQPFLIFLVTLMKWEAPPLPVLDIGPLMVVLGGILGLSGSRTFEKVRGVTGVSVGSK